MMATDSAQATARRATGRSSGGGRPPLSGRARYDLVRRRVLQVLAWIPLLLLVLWTMIPFLVTLGISFKSRGEVFADPGLLPNDPTLGAYGEVLARPGFRATLLNSVLVGLGTTALTLAISMPAAYAFARFRFAGRHLLLLFTLLPRLVPSLGLMVPLYRIAVALGALDRRLTLIVVYTGMLVPLAVWLLVGFYQRIPRELEEAANVDGCNLFKRMRYIVIPLSVPALITIGVLAFREAWNEFTLVLVLTTTPGKRTLPYELFTMQGIEGIPNFPAEAAFALLTVLPFIFVYMRIERYVVSGITSGAVK
ncbi:MAG: ABC transporter permease subunit [Streptosporangiales bacterium]|nr:ABC transporter permease subunit [Streptosporangiales bacterium]